MKNLTGNGTANIADGRWMQQGFCTLMQLTHALSSSARVQLIEAERQVRQQQERLAHADLERRLAAVERQQAAWRDEQQTATIRQLQDSNAAMGSKIDALKAQLVEGDTALAESEKHVGTARADVEALKVVLAQLVSGMESAAVRRRTVRH